MRSIFVLAFVVAAVVAEPPRRRFNFRAFARQEVEDNGSGYDGEEATEQPQGYSYVPPAESEQLRLPARFSFNKFARQEQQPTNGGYSYPKPDEEYGTPAPPPDSTEPSNEYGTPAPEESSTDDDESTDNPAATADSEIERLKSIQASQFRLRSGKFASPQKLVRAKVVQQKQQQQQRQQQLVQVQQQPIIYVDYPIASDLLEPQYVYIFK
jgi:hypothetical protein